VPESAEAGPAANARPTKIMAVVLVTTAIRRRIALAFNRCIASDKILLLFMDMRH
jgi:hypothetical protein